MSTTRAYPIACPKCRHAIEAQLHESINTRDDPGLREALLANRVNAVACPGCGFAFRVDKPLFYHDPGRGFLIHWLPLGSATAEEGERQFGEMTGELARLAPAGVALPSLHLVFTRAELVERIFLLEAGLDERLVEYVKHLVFSKNAGRLDPARKTLLFDAQDSTGEALCFVVQDVASGRLESVLQYGREAYEALGEMFGAEGASPSLRDLFPGPYVSARRLLQSEPDPGRER
jgi:hypothetical protein